MKIDKEEIISLDEPEKKETQKKKGGGVVLKVFGVLALCALLMGAEAFYFLRFYEPADKITGEEKESGNGENEVPVLSDSVVYSQEELDARISEALQNISGEEAERILGEIRESLSQGMSTLDTLRPLYPHELIVASGGRYHFVPINYELKMNDYEQANLEILDSGEFRYLTEGQVTSHKGIDVSSHQGKIKWEQVAQDGVEFAMIRVGFRGYGKAGKLVEDEQFDDNIQGASKAGIKVGVYFFSQATTEEEVDEEVELVLNKIKPYRLDCPVVVDVERVDDAQGRMNLISVEERTALMLRFCEKIEEAGYKPMLYHNTEMSAIMIDIAAFEKYDKWYASYTSKMFYPYAYSIWQYSNKGKVSGISTAVDLNISFEPVWE
ncbi:MAG: glycoside hydrolase family 25 protein [Acetatifactor sp.]